MYILCILELYMRLLLCVAWTSWSESMCMCSYYVSDVQVQACTVSVSARNSNMCHQLAITDNINAVVCPSACQSTCQTVSQTLCLLACCGPPGSLRCQCVWSV